MNPVTQQVIEFLTHPGLPFGSEEDLLLLNDPEALREHAAFLLEDRPNVLGQQESQSLKSHLGEANGPLIAQEFQARVNLAANFFDRDATSEAQKS